MYDKVSRGQSGNVYNYARILRKLEAGHQELVEYAYQVLDALDFRYGPSHGEYMMTEAGPVLIEVGARPMGGHFPKPLLGHHLTDVSLDAYLDPEAFERARKRPYRTSGFLMNKFFITPQGGAVASYPVLAILRCLKTMAGGSLAPARRSGFQRKFTAAAPLAASAWRFCWRRLASRWRCLNTAPIAALSGRLA